MKRSAPNSAWSDRWWLALAVLAAALGVVAALAWEMPLPYWGEL